MLSDKPSKPVFKGIAALAVVGGVTCGVYACKTTGGGGDSSSAKDTATLNPDNPTTLVDYHWNLQTNNVERRVCPPLAGLIQDLNNLPPVCPLDQTVAPMPGATFVKNLLAAYSTMFLNGQKAGETEINFVSSRIVPELQQPGAHITTANDAAFYMRFVGLYDKALRMQANGVTPTRPVRPGSLNNGLIARTVSVFPVGASVLTVPGPSTPLLGFRVDVNQGCGVFLDSAVLVDTQGGGHFAAFNAQGLMRFSGPITVSEFSVNWNNPTNQPQQCIVELVALVQGSNGRPTMLDGGTFGPRGGRTNPPLLDGPARTGGGLLDGPANGFGGGSGGRLDGPAEGFGGGSGGQLDGPADGLNGGGGQLDSAGGTF
jgi:hypothetical protein